MTTNDLDKKLFWEDNFLSPLSKDELIKTYIRRMYARTNMMFEYANLPETIDKTMLELMLQQKGYLCGFSWKGKPYILFGALAGKPNKYYLPSQMIVTNPFLNINGVIFDIDKNCVWCKNDSSWQGLNDMFLKYATLLSEVDISIKYGAINSRILNIITAKTDRTFKSAKEFLKKVEQGEELGIIMSNPEMDDLKTYPYGGNTNNYLKDLIELRQYLLANWYIDLGINANYNMKRESLSQNEVAVNEDTLTPLIDSMLEEREKFIKQYNEMFGTSIEVRLNSSWWKINEEIELEIKAKETEIEQVKNEESSKNEEKIEEGENSDESKGNE